MLNILTLNWNGLDKLKCLQPTLMKNLDKLGVDAKWYIRDNGSTDGSKEWLKYQSDIRVLDIDHNRDNFSKGINSLADLIVEENSWTCSIGRTIGATRALWPNQFLLLNNDIIFNDDMSLFNMYELMRHSTSIQIVGARLLYNNSSKLQHAGVIFGPRYGNMPYHFRHGEESDKNAKKNRYFQAVTAACCLINSNEFFEVGGLNENLSWAFEDIDLNLKFGQLGWKIAYCGETNIYHEESATLRKNPMNKLFVQQNVKLFKEKWIGKYEIDHDKYLSNSSYLEIS